jgi:hypothetical protein
MLQYTKFNRLIVAGIAAAAIAPTAALASPTNDVGGTTSDKQDMRAPDQVAGGAPGTGVVQDLRAPDQVAPGSKAVEPQAGPPQWPVNPQPIVNAAPSAATSDDGIDDGVLIAIGGGALLLVGGLGVAGRKRLQVVRRRQLA